MQMALIKARYDHKVLILRAHSRSSNFDFVFTSVFVKVNDEQGIYIMQNLLQCITFMFVAALIVHHATVSN